MFTCPRCLTKLTTLRRREGLSWICVHCDGRAVNTATLSRTVSRKLTASLWAHATAEPLPSALSCPACNGRMCATEIQAGEDRVILDLCRPCGLVWFDGGEMEIVREPLTPSSPAQVIAHPSPGGLDRDAVIARFELEHLRAMRESDPASFEPDAGWKYVPAILGLPVEVDAAELEHRPWLTWALLAMTAGVSVLAGTAYPALFDALAFHADAPVLDRIVASVTCTLVHASIPHLVFNLYWLWIFGERVEDRVGRVRFALLYVLAGIGGALLQGAVTRDPGPPLVGASAAISGLIATFAVEFPRARIGLMTRIPSSWSVLSLTFSARTWFVLWIGCELVASMFSFPPIAHAAHLGGALVGLLYGWSLRQSYGAAHPPPD